MTRPHKLRLTECGRALIFSIALTPSLLGCDSSSNEEKDETNSAGAAGAGAMLGEGDDDSPPLTAKDDSSNPNQLTHDTLFECEGPIASSPARLKRIDSEEWAASIGREGTDSRLNPLGKDPEHQYSTFASGETLNTVTLERFIDFTPDSVVGWSGPSDCSCAPQPEGIACMYEEISPDRDCVAHYVNRYLSDYVLFRPARDDEVNRLSAFASLALEKAAESGFDRAAVMTQINSAAWLTTGALFRSEVGLGEEMEDNITSLDDAELAKNLAYTLTDSGPGAPAHSVGVRLGDSMLLDIVDARTSGDLRHPDTIAAIVQSNFGGIDPDRNPYASEFWLSAKLARFFREWLGTDVFRTSFHDDPLATSGLDEFQGSACKTTDECPTKWSCDEGYCTPHINGSYNNLKAAAYGNELTLDAQLGEMIARIVVEDKEVLKNLLTSRTFFTPSSVTGGQKFTSAPQFVYNRTESVADDREERWWQAPEGERSGILTHPAWLASHGDNFENGTSAIHRGKWIRENLLCGTVPDVPINVDASFSEETNQQSARERLNTATKSPACQKCHEQMDPLGLPFEVYNHAGFFRREDHGGPPDGSSLLLNTGDATLDVQVTNAAEMSQLFAESEVVERCFIRQVFRYFVGRPETEKDACALVSMQTTYRKEGGSLRAMLENLLSSPAITHRHIEDIEEDR